ncbi:MAG: hypothetical protein AAFU64_02935, partial [Bacteroidota bacterium]
LASLAFILKPDPLSQGTCGGYDIQYEAFHFFNPISFEKLIDFKWRSDETQKDNLQEWMAYFPAEVSESDVAEIVYQVSADDMQAIRAHVTSSGSLSASLLRNSLVQYWKRNPDVNTIDYLYYAKVCEPQARSYAYWDQKKRDPEKMSWLANAGRDYYRQKGSNVFLKNRFAYQAIRMAHYVKDYSLALELYEELAAPLFDQSESIIRYWSLAHKAGALEGLGKENEAAYLFSRVFAQCPSKEVSSFLSFKIGSEKEWQSCLALCQSPEEKINLYFMRSLDRNSNGLEEMKSVYEIDPSSEILPLMLVREINKLEYDLLSINISENLLFVNGYQNFPYQESIQHLMKVKAFIGSSIKKGGLANPDLWALADGYLSFVAGNPQRAQSIYSDLKKSTKNKNFKDQISLFELALKISRLRKIDDQIEDQIYEEVKRMNHPEIKELMIKAFANLYDRQGQKAKAYLCEGYISNLKVYPQGDLIDDLIALTSKKKPSNFESEFLFPRIQDASLTANKASKARELMMEIKATVLFSEDRLQEALAIYEQLPDDIIYKIEEDPFQDNLIDCQNCPPSINKNKYNRKTLIIKILKLKELIKNTSADRAAFYYQLGSAYYNMTYFGNAWIAQDYFRSSQDFWEYRDEKRDERKKLPIFADCGKAKYYFDRAITSFLRIGNQEMAARSCFMAAKCEQNAYFLDPQLSGTEYSYGAIPPSYDPAHRLYFRRLKKDFANTQFYEEIIDECTYFNEFIRP